VLGVKSFIMKMTRIAVTTDQNRNKISGLESDVKSIKSDLRKFNTEQKKIAKDIASIKKTISSLNLGNRLFFQHKTVFNSLQRKIERLEALEKEWIKYRDTLDKKMKMYITKKNRASVSI
jgi:chromosome segregation ATPase